MTRHSPRGAISFARAPRPDLLVFDIHGRISRPDVEWMAGVSDAAFDRHGVIDMMLVMRPWEGEDLDAALDRMALRTQARGVRHVRRYAVVGAPAWARAMIGLSGSLSPVETRAFDLDEIDEARRWVGESRASH